MIESMSQQPKVGHKSGQRPTCDFVLRLVLRVQSWRCMCLDSKSGVCLIESRSSYLPLTDNASNPMRYDDYDYDYGPVGADLLPRLWWCCHVSACCALCSASDCFKIMINGLTRCTEQHAGCPIPAKPPVQAKHLGKQSLHRSGFSRSSCLVGHSCGILPQSSIWCSC